MCACVFTLTGSLTPRRDLLSKHNISLYEYAARASAYESHHGFTVHQCIPFNCLGVFLGGEGELSARGPRLHPRSHLGRLHPAGSLSLRSAFGMLRRCRYLWRLIPAPASNTKPVIGPRRALAPRSDGIIDWSVPVSMTLLALRFVVVSAPRGGATVTVTERCEWACCG